MKKIHALLFLGAFLLFAGLGRASTSTHGSR